MIRAAVRHAKKEGPPPPELNLVFQWRTWGVLPNSGGLRDQRAGDLDRMLSVANAYDLMTLHKKGGLKDMTSDQILYLERLKKLDG